MQIGHTMLSSNLDPSRLTNLTTLVKNNALDEVKQLVEQEIALTGNDWRRGNNEKYVHLAFYEAIRLGLSEILKFFLSAGISPMWGIYNKDVSGSFIKLAVLTHNLSIVKLLVGHAVNQSGKHGKYYRPGDDSAIVAAVKNGDADIVQYLLENAADANAWCERSNGTTLLARAAEDNNGSIIESLLKHGASIEETLKSAY